MIRRLRRWFAERGKETAWWSEGPEPGPPAPMDTTWVLDMKGPIYRRYRAWEPRTSAEMHYALTHAVPGDFIYALGDTNDADGHFVPFAT